MLNYHRVYQRCFIYLGTTIPFRSVNQIGILPSDRRISWKELRSEAQCHRTGWPEVQAQVFLMVFMYIYTVHTYIYIAYLATVGWLLVQSTSWLSYTFIITKTCNCSWHSAIIWPYFCTMLQSGWYADTCGTYPPVNIQKDVENPPEMSIIFRKTIGFSTSFCSKNQVFHIFLYVNTLG